jgi:hypothetical protein
LLFDELIPVHIRKPGMALNILLIECAYPLGWVLLEQRIDEIFAVLGNVRFGVVKI